MWDACKDGLGLCCFINEFAQVDLPKQIYMVNQGAMLMANNKRTDKRSKHILLRYHMKRDCYNKGIIKLTYIGTEHNTADMMTTAVDMVKTQVLHQLVSFRQGNE